MINEYGAVGGKQIGRGSLSIWRKRAPVQVYQPKMRFSREVAGYRSIN
jgi:hypothetical protein